MLAAFNVGFGLEANIRTGFKNCKMLLYRKCEEQKKAHRHRKKYKSSVFIGMCIIKKKALDLGLKSAIY